MTDDIKIDGKAAIARARREIQEDTMKKAVKLLKEKLVEEQEAVTIVENIRREIKDLELKIEQGNV